MKKLKYFGLLVLLLIVIGGLSAIKPIPQHPDYNNFADTRTMLYIHNFMDVMSNVPFVIFGLMGLHFLYTANSKKTLFLLRGEKLVWWLFFIGVVVIGFGSSYYHVAPNNTALVFDRIPIIFTFMSLFTFVVMDRIGDQFGLVLYPLLVFLGVASVLYWYYTESIGQGDMRFYVFMQGAPLLLIPLMMWLFPGHYTDGKYILYAIGLYVVSKLFEFLDKPIFVITGNIISGHSLKHLAAACGVYVVLLYLKDRQGADPHRTE